jgi:hypothetical protein
MVYDIIGGFPANCMNMSVENDKNWYNYYRAGNYAVRP